MYGLVVLRAIIFDFNGVLVDDEPIHLEMFQEVLREKGLTLTEKEYYERYLGLDDRGCFKLIFRDHGMSLDENALAELIRQKAACYRAAVQKRIIVFPGVKELIPTLSRRFRLAVASGALRSEIDMILEGITLKKYFQVIVSTEDVSEGKPSPEIFVKALALLNQGERNTESIGRSECLVIEDSKEGILAARRAGLKCLAVTNSHPAEELTDADAVVGSLQEVTIPYLEKLVS